MHRYKLTRQSGMFECNERRIGRKKTNQITKSLKFKPNQFTASAILHSSVVNRFATSASLVSHVRQDKGPKG
jgi:hypothetical protein